MALEKTESVRDLLAQLHAERVATWKPEDLQVNIDQRALLERTADRDGFVKPGDAVAPFTLREVGGADLSLDAVLARGPAVLVFFRFAGCPACNIALPYYQRKLHPELERLGATLIAVSPQRGDRLVEIKTRHDFPFPVVTDADNALGRAFGILYSFDEPSRRAALKKGTPIGDVTGTGTWELPMPAVIVIGQDRVVAFADVSPDWLARTEAEPVVEAVRKLAASSQSIAAE
ncbi:MAG: peroxiredoxin-like family protein [Rhizomicrobium sp.]